MTIDHRACELIGRHLDGLADEAEIVELEARLVAEPAVAQALARSARLDESLGSVVAGGFEVRAFAPRPVRRVTTMTVLAAAAILVLVFGWRALGKRRADPPVSVLPAAAIESPAGAISLGDGCFAIPRDGDSVIRAEQQAAGEIVVELVRGAARFEVRPDPARAFRVLAGAVTVEVLGTIFTVDRALAAVRVAVDRGRVRVDHGTSTSYLAAGQSAIFETEAAAVGSTPPDNPDPGKGAERSWQKLARSGRYDRAFEALQQEGPSAVRDEPGELMLAADTARLSEHPAQAVAPLRRLMARHRSDPRAPFAAFTLGRVLLEELGNPREAALAFAEARGLIGTGSLAEDAVAREVEAWARAGDERRARELAETYVERYPRGSKLQSVRRYGKLP